MLKAIIRRVVQPNLKSPKAKLPKAQAIAFVAICLGFFMVVVDAGIVNVAIPTIGRSLGNSLNNLEWVINSYTLVLASLLLTAGAIGDRIGSKRLYLFGLALFTIASLWCSLSTTLNLLIVARVLQGMGGAMLIPTSLSLIVHMYPDPRARSRAIGIWATIVAAGFAGSITLSGLLVDAFGWRSIFWFNVPFGLLAFVLAWRFVPKIRSTKWHNLDLSGQALALITLFALTFALIEGQVQGWRTPFVLIAFLTSAITAVLFGIVEYRSHHPMLPLELFTVPAFSTATFVGLFWNFCFYGQAFLFSLFFQTIQGYSATATGFAFLPQVIANLIAPTFSGWLVARMGPRIPMANGLLISGIGSLILASVNQNTSYLVIALGFTLFGLGTGTTMPAMTTTVLANAPSEQSGIASAILNSMRQTGGVLGVAILSIFISGTSFIQGMPKALVAVSLVSLLGCALTLIYVPNGKLRHH